MNIKKITPLFFRIGKKAEILPASRINSLPQADSCGTGSQKPIGVDFAYASPIIHNNYKYKPISRLVPNYELLNCDYNNLDEFSEAFAKKINSQLMDINESDIESLISRIKIKTGADTNLIREVLYNLTEFSSYNAIDFFQKTAEQYSTCDFGLEFRADCESDYSMNCALNYLSRSKQIIKSSKTGRKRIIVLDDMFLKQLESSKKYDGKFYSIFMNYLKHDELIFLNLKGWDIKCLDNKYRSANFLCGTGFLEDMAVDTIKRMQNGENLDIILYGDFEKRLSDITGQDIKTEKLSNTDKSGQKTTQSILYNVKKPSLTAQDIKSGILSYARQASCGENEYKYNLEHAGSFCKYLDLNSFVYSTDSLAMELINLKKKIEKKCGKNYAYVVLEPRKSFGYISAIYAKLHNINPEDIATLGTAKDIANIFPDKTNYVAIDDIAASGDTIASYLLEAWEFKETCNSNMYFANILATQDSIERFCDEDVLLYLRKLKNPFEGYNELLNENDILFLYSKLGKSWSNLHLSCVFPHIIPDNSSEFSGRLFSKLLFKNTPKTNKTLPPSD